MRPSPSDVAPRASTSLAAAEVVLTAGFILTGTITTLLGPLLPALVAKWALSDARAGAFFVAQFAASTIGALSSDALARRFGTKPHLIVGFLLLGAGVVTLSIAPADLALIAVACYGLGLGLTIPSINLTIADIRRESSASALNVLNLLWTVGALASPVIVSTALRSGHLRMALGLLAAIAFAISAAVATTRLNTSTIVSTPDEHRSLESSSTSVWILFACVFFLYVGLENAIAGWAAAYAQRTGVTHTIASAALVPAAFWIALLMGRAIFAVLMLRLLPARAAANTGMALCFTGSLLLLIANSPAIMITGVSLAGFGLAPVYPNAIAHAKTLLAGRNIPALFACAGAGGAVVPYLVGVVASHTAQLSSGIRFAFLVCCLLTALQFRVSHLSQPSA